MRGVRLRDDRGQTIPIYVVVVGSLLFLAFAYFAFAQAAVARNGAQSAADASALAAAQDVRDELADGFLNSLDNQDDWVKWLLMEQPVHGTGEAAASQLAGDNDATLDGLAPTTVAGYPAFRASITTNYTAGKSILPVTSKSHAKAHAVAVIEPRCSVTPGNDTDFIEFTCGDDPPWKIDPKHLDDLALPEAKDLFSVHLAE
ncbi:pilus assembly protein TadG-related protein [Streptomyces sp. NBC_01465]|uniref:pilus assembly protein TadG-related protein n=1 Tax=Streptomyces sp. NBC_01465 TaxID=2903878 RepID=UPI002E3418A9|nr:pilus assembly protein TadG-related protein [Streptomyces sp. NBC_01465]